MANYVQEKGIDIRHELWKKGYRVNPDTFSEKEFEDFLNAFNYWTSIFPECEVTFEMMFEAVFTQHPEWLIDEVKERYQKNKSLLQEYFQTYFAGKTRDEIFGDKELRERWNYYSDWHKEVFNYRPYDFICGAYVDTRTGERLDW